MKEAETYTSGELLQQLSQRIEHEMHGDQTGFKCIATFVSVDSLSKWLGDFELPQDASVAEQSLAIANYVNSCELLERIGQSILQSVAQESDNPGNTLAASIVERMESKMAIGAPLLPEIFYYVSGGFEYGLAYFIAIDDRFWDDSQLTEPNEDDGVASTSSPLSHQAACDDIARHAYERNQQHSGTEVISGFIPHEFLLADMPEFENKANLSGRALSKELAEHLRATDKDFRLIAMLLQHISDDENHGSQELAYRIKTQMQSDFSKPSEEFRKPMHYLAGADEGLAIAITIDDRFWTEEW